MALSIYTGQVGACDDSDNGATDSHGDGCWWYDSYPAYCGHFDDNDFKASRMCCACKKGKSRSYKVKNSNLIICLIFIRS